MYRGNVLIPFRIIADGIFINVDGVLGMDLINFTVKPMQRRLSKFYHERT